MSNNQTVNHDARPQTSERSDVLKAIGSKWSKFSREELAEFKTSDEVVAQLVAKYGVEKDAAQRDVDALMNGRSLAA